MPPLTRFFVGALFALGLSLSGSARASTYALEEIPMVVPAEDAAKLRATGVATTFALLEKGADVRGRRALATATKIPQKTIDGWVKMADLMRLRGVGPDVARLLTAVGVATVLELQKADAQKTADAIAKVAASQKLSENPPSAEHLQAWIGQAKNLPIVLH
jgi:predicted flap endonuclease-1-like 5' DNA nuclease